jgi:hypothetical protein
LSFPTIGGSGGDHKVEKGFSPEAEQISIREGVKKYAPEQWHQGKANADGTTLFLTNVNKSGQPTADHV